MLKKEIIKGLVADPKNILVKNASVVDISVSVSNGSIRLALQVDKPVHDYVLQPDGTYSKEEVRHPIFTSFYDLMSSLIRQSDSLKYVERWLQYDVDNPAEQRKLTELEVKENLIYLLGDAKITYIEEDIEGAISVSNNPFNPVSVDYTPQHNQIRWWITDAELGMVGKLTVAEQVRKKFPTLDVMDIVKNFGL